MPFEYKPKVTLTESELYHKANTGKRGELVPPEKRIGLSQAYALSSQEEKPTPLKELAEKSKQEHPFIIPAEMLPPGSRFRPSKEPQINPEPTS